MSSPYKRKRLKRRNEESIARCLNFLIFFYNNYNLLVEEKTIGDKINKLMKFFGEIMEAINEKNTAIIRAHPNQSKEVMNKLAFTPTMNPGRYIIQNKIRHGIIRSEEDVANNGKEVSAPFHSETSILSSSVVRKTPIERSSFEPMKKKKKIGENIVSGLNVYTSFQSPLHLENEQVTIDQLMQFIN